MKEDKFYLVHIGGDCTQAEKNHMPPSIPAKAKRSLADACKMTK